MWPALRAWAGPAAGCWGLLSLALTGVGGIGENAGLVERQLLPPSTII